MANASAWSSQQPSGASQIRQSDDRIRSHQSILEATLEEEHYFTSTSSASSAGQHKLGSARIFVGAASSVSTRPDTGRLMWVTDAQQLAYVGHGSLNTIPSIGTRNNWTGFQDFTTAGASLSTGTVTALHAAATLRLNSGATLSRAISGTTRLASPLTITASGLSAFAVTVSGVTSGDLLLTSLDEESATLDDLTYSVGVSRDTADTVVFSVRNNAGSARVLSVQTINVVAMRLA